MSTGGGVPPGHGGGGARGDGRADGEHEVGPDLLAAGAAQPAAGQQSDAGHQHHHAGKPYIKYLNFWGQT